MKNDLQRFMELVGASDVEVATATGLHRTAVYRIRKGSRSPTGETLMLLSEWAAKAAVKKRIKVSERLSWGYLVPERRKAS